MKAFILGILFSSSSWAMNGGDVVNNGGGLSEQSVMFAAQHYRFFVTSCLRYDSCGAKMPVRATLEKVRSCPLPEVNALRFATPNEAPELKGGRAYVLSVKGHFIIDREKLYSPRHEALRVAEAFGYLSRIYLDHCGAMAFDQSADFVKPLTRFADSDGEQVTIGKDSIKLPSKEWIRIRTLYSDLIIEGPKSLLRLSCPIGELKGCTLLDTAESKTLSKFKNLSLAEESLNNDLLSFEVQGSFIRADRTRDYFTLRAEFQKGDVLSLKLQGQNLELPHN